MIRLAGILLATALLVGCQKDETIAGQTTPDTIWVLTNLNDAPFEGRFTIQFGENGAVSGQMDCNRYTATQTAPLPWFELGPIASTKALCPAAQSEQAFSKTLGAAETAELQGNVLLISGPEGELVFSSGG